ncbi:RAxF-45 family protein [Staphylospora marina]
MAWFVAEISNITYAFVVNGIRMPFFGHLNKTGP